MNTIFFSERKIVVEITIQMVRCQLTTGICLPLPAQKEAVSQLFFSVSHTLLYYQDKYSKIVKSFKGSEGAKNISIIFFFNHDVRAGDGK